MTCTAVEDDGPCERPDRTRGLCTMHYQRVLKWGSLSPRNTRKYVTEPQCPKCKGEMRSVRGMTSAVGSIVARQRACLSCQTIHLTLEAPVSQRSVEKMGETLLGSFFAKTQRVSATRTPRKARAAAASTGTTTAETSASSDAGS